MGKKLIFTGLFILINILFLPAQSIFIEAESFNQRGGWVIDQQSIDQMGSPYLMAHGLGTSVEDAVTHAKVPESGEYRVWVRTRNWLAPWNITEYPGKFQLIINDNPLDTFFGTEGSDWHWQDGETIILNQGNVSFVLHDLTGFNGRCDAILLTRDLSFKPPDDRETLERFRRIHRKIPETPKVAGDFDLVVVGGGMAGICTAISAARLNCKVALIQNRPVLGGNNSSEVRVGLSGLIFQEPYPNLGKLVDEVGSVGHWTLWEAERNPNAERSRRIMEVIKEYPEKKIHNAGPASNYGDEKKLQMVLNEKNISLFLNTHVFEVGKAGDKIVSVSGESIITGEELIFRGSLFADCTGDGNVGFLAEADYREGRESRSETGESHAPEKADNLVMGTSVQWYAEEYAEPQVFQECPWAIQFTEETCQHLLRGDWDWETGFFRDQVEDIEYIRDHALRAVFGNWDFLKNKSHGKDKYQNCKLSWVAYIGGKRESRRILGDIVIREQDILNRIKYPDESFTTTWGIDLHYPKEIDGFNEEPFLSIAKTTKIEPYAIPYRCLYSRNIDNLFMAGRNISVTHVVLGTIRVMRTGGMMGEVVGMAASLATKYKTGPRGVYTNHLDELKLLMEKGVGK